jgi:hypothetical protein
VPGPAVPVPEAEVEAFVSASPVSLEGHATRVAPESIKTRA